MDVDIHVQTQCQTQCYFVDSLLLFLFRSEKCPWLTNSGRKYFATRFDGYCKFFDVRNRFICSQSDFIAMVRVFQANMPS